MYTCSGVSGFKFTSFEDLQMFVNTEVVSFQEHVLGEVQVSQSDVLIRVVAYTPF